MRLYLDTSPAIYFVERTANEAAVRAWLAKSSRVVTGELTRLECLIVPVRNNDLVLASEFEDFFAYFVDEFYELSRPVYDLAISIRANDRFEAVDSLQLALAVDSGCDVFLTNDHKLTRFAGIRVELV